MNNGTLLLGVVLLALVGAIPLFWMVFGGVLFGAPFIPLIITIILAIAGITFVVRGLTNRK